VFLVTVNSLLTCSYTAYNSAGNASAPALVKLYVERLNLVPIHFTLGFANDTEARAAADAVLSSYTASAALASAVLPALLPASDISALRAALVTAANVTQDTNSTGGWSVSFAMSLSLGYSTPPDPATVEKLSAITDSITAAGGSLRRRRTLLSQAAGLVPVDSIDRDALGVPGLHLTAGATPSGDVEVAQSSDPTETKGAPAAAVPQRRRALEQLTLDSLWTRSRQVMAEAGYDSEDPAPETVIQTLQDSLSQLQEVASASAAMSALLAQTVQGSVLQTAEALGTKALRHLLESTTTSNSNLTAAQIALLSQLASATTTNCGDYTPPNITVSATPTNLTQPTNVAGFGQVQLLAWPQATNLSSGCLTRVLSIQDLLLGTAANAMHSVSSSIAQVGKE
jgi:hypothetical protein